MINLILAGVWLGLALLAFAQPHLNPGGREWTIPVFDWSLPVSWLALGFFGYNLVRWGAGQRRRPPKPSPAPRQHQPQREPSDPQWDFSQSNPHDESK